MRSADEAVAALEGGASIIDVKEPERGALGRATPAVQRAVVRAVRGFDPAAKVTAALGELRPGDDPSAFEPPEGIALFKLGLSGWKRRQGWEDALDRWVGHLAAYSAALAVVAYADHEIADSPSPLEVLRFVVKRRYRFLLLDTFSKGTGSLRTFLGDNEIRAFICGGRVLRVHTAIAGSLRLEDIPLMAAFDPDVIAVRGAACAEGRREAAVDPERVAALARSISSRRRRPASRAFSARGSRALRRV